MPEMHDEERITRALERAPAVVVPADFAARVMARLPERKARPAPEAGWLPRRTHYGRNAMLAGAVLLCCLLVAGAVASHGDAAWRVAEWTALAQLAGIALWCGLAWRMRGSV
ncbi:MAG TPA: hypothetical protein VH139_01815 [Acidobacteriaceae bacterium]|jgi:hypothetical protein|nr:hypothetical protein [Acidobacteriaceae bacterium]